MPKLTVLVGPPGSGKSTLAKEYEAKGFVRINQDDQGKDGHYKLFIQTILEDKRDLVIDRLNFDKQQRDKYISRARMNGYETEIIVLHQPYAECYKRMMAREGHPTIRDERSATSALNMFFSKYEHPKQDEANKVTFVYPEGEKIKAIWVDLDGTIANCEHRRHFVRPDVPTPGFKKNWREFFNHMMDDTINIPVASVVKGMNKLGYLTVFCSGRPGSYKGETVNWLKDHRSDWSIEDRGFHLYMRPRSDSRQDNIVKEVMLDFEILTRFNILFCLDDRDQVVQMLRRRGMTVFQVADGNF